jgi:hypothetical protein
MVALQPSRRERYTSWLWVLLDSSQEISKEHQLGGTRLNTLRKMQIFIPAANSFGNNIFIIFFLLFFGRIFLCSFRIHQFEQLKNIFKAHQGSKIAFF